MNNQEEPSQSDLEQDPASLRQQYLNDKKLRDERLAKEKNARWSHFLLPIPLIKRLRVKAAEQEKSMTSILIETLDKTL